MKKLLMLAVVVALLLVMAVPAFATTNRCPPRFLTRDATTAADLRADRNMDDIVCHRHVVDTLVVIDNHLPAE